MAKPEIARRCPVCGASIREAALFCPQCGEQMGSHNVKEKPAAVVETTPVELSSGPDEKRDKDNRAGTDKGKGERPEAFAAPPTEPSVDKASVGKVRDKIQRATTLARDVEGDVKHRVQKVRKMSGVVLDEAGYDPSLRFVLVAAVLFLLFLLVLLLNKLIV